MTILKGASMARISKGQLEKLQKKYLTDEAVGKLYGISRQAVHQLRKKYGIAAIENKHGERNRDLVGQYAAGTSGTKLAGKFDLSISQTYRLINQAKGKKGGKHRKK
jgi:hypothetical protein